jgi:uncharacterized protein (DUF983 family)
MSRAIPSIPALLMRGLTKRCPWCGQGKLFRRWFTLPERCPRCGLRFEREEGAFLGSLAINFGVTAAVFIAVLVTWVALTLPDVPAVPVAVTSVVLTVVLPLAIYPFAKTTWAAIDLLLNWDREDIRALARAMRDRDAEPGSADDGPGPAPSAGGR